MPTFDLPTATRLRFDSELAEKTLVVVVVFVVVVVVFGNGSLHLSNVVHLILFPRENSQAHLNQERRCLMSATLSHKPNVSPFWPRFPSNTRI